RRDRAGWLRPARRRQQGNDRCQPLLPRLGAQQGESPRALRVADRPHYLKPSAARFRPGAFALAALALLTGCQATVGVDATIRRDGTGTVVATATLDKAAVTAT